ncbi:MAG TPA: protein kinase [Thermoanaerobaculia bacterium]|nr:protein kinase [Thermoanaerobaculia bacterium]
MPGEPTARAPNTVALEAEAPKPRISRRESARFPLLLKLFLLTGLIVLVVVGIAVGVTIRRSEEIAARSVDEGIREAASLYGRLSDGRLRELRLGADTLGDDVSFMAYVQDALYGSPEPAALPEDDSADAAPSAPPAEDAAEPESAAPVAIDYASILDQLEQRRALLGSDLLVLTDDEGYLVARTDQPAVASSSRVDLYEDEPLVRQVIDDPDHAGAEGLIVLGGRLYHAAVAPLSAGARAIPVGYLVNALAIDDAFATTIGKATRTGVLFLASPEVAEESVAVRSANAPNAEALRRSAEMSSLFAGKSLAARRTTIDNSAYVLTGEPLVSAGRVVAAAIFVRSLAAELAPFQEIERTLLIAGGIALLLALILSWLFAKRISRPITELAGMAQAVADGDYSVQPQPRGRDEVAILARSFAQMVSALRDKSELEQLYEEMAARTETAAGIAAVQPAASREGTVLVTDLRGLPSAVGEGKAEDVIALVSAAMKLQSSEIRRQDGRVLEVVGHRLVSLFEGERGVIHAIRAARAIHEEMALRMSEQRLAIGAGIASGDLVTGGIDLEGLGGLAIVGNAPLLALLFAWEAPTGHAYVSLETAQAAGSEILGASTREEVRLKWLPAPLPVAALPLSSMTTGMVRIDAAATTSAAATMRLDVQPRNADLTAGDLFAGRYRIQELLGRGGMGVVYQAHDTQLDETVALKVLPREMLSRSGEELERFKREIRLARRITHRNVLRTYDYGEADGVYFISMEYIRGYTLAEMMEKNAKMAPRISMGIARQICRGLQAAHEEGIIHRDIKPQNVLIDQRGEVKLMDFGIARMTEASEAMTQAGIVVGTPHYMSPEQVQGKKLDARSDVYSMGVMMYQMLVGKLPFAAPSLTAVLTAHITETPQPPIELRPEIGKEINAIVVRCLAKEPKKRYEDGGKLLADLDKLQMGVVAA